MVTTTISTDSVKTFLDILTNILSVVNDIVGAFDDIGLSAPLMVSVIASAGKTIKALGTNTPLTMTFGNGIFSVLSKLGIQTQQNTQTIQQNTQSAEQNQQVQQGYRVALTNTANASLEASAKTALLTTGMTLLNTLISGVVIAGITIAVKKIYEYAKANEIAHDKIADAIEVTKSTISSYKQQKSELKDIAEEYDNLAGKSKLSNDELERYNQLQSQIAKLAPDLVVGYDADNNPILALNGSLEDYIDGLDDVIERQQKLLANQQNSLANKSRQELKNINRTTERTITPWNSADYSSAWNDLVPWNNAKLKNARDGADEYIKIIEKRNKVIDDLNIDLAESFEKFNSIEMEQQQSVLNKLGNEDRYENFNNLGKKTKNAMETLIDNFNWGSSVVETTAGQEKFIKNFDLLSEKIGKNTSQVQEWNKELATANSSWQQTGDLEQYKKDIHGVAQEIADLTDTNVDDWVTGFANELQGGLSESAISLNNFLKSYNKTFTDIEGEDKVALKLSLEYDATSEFLKDLTAEGQTREEMVDWIVRVNSGEIKYNGELPYQIKAMIEGSLDGGETLKDYERRLIMKVSTIIQSQGELDDKTFNLITKMLNGQLTDTEIKAGIELPDETTLNSELIGTINEINKNKENNVKVGVELNKDRLNEDLETILDGDDNKELRINLKTAVEDNKLETYNDLVKDMSEEKQIDIATAFVEYGDMTAEEFDNFIKNLPEEVQTAIKFIIDDGGIDDSIFNSNEVQTILVNVEDEDAYNKIFNLATELDKLDMNRDLKIDIVENLGKGTTEGIIQALDSIKNLPDEQKMTIITNITSVMAGMEGLDKQQISDKIVEIKDEDDASDDIDKVQGETIDDKDVTINATDNASSTMDKIEQKELSDKELTIWMKVKESVTNAFNPLYNKFKDTLFKKSLNTSFTNISSTPEEADMGAKVNKAFTNLSTSPEITDTSDNTIGSTISNGISNFKAKALRPFGSVGSSTTLDTSINISKNTLDSIEYGVELLQELEYRIQNVNNKLDLLDVKMERAVGTEKIKYLQKQNELYTEQAKLQKELYDSLTEEKLVIKDKLRDYGFSFDAQGNLTKYEETLLKMEKKAEQLEESAKKASEKASNYETKSSSIDTSKYDTSKYNTTGKNLTKSEKAEMQKKKEAVNQAKKNAQAKAKAEAEASQKVKKSLESQADKAQEVSDEYKEKLESVKKLTEEYLQIQETDIGDAEREWQELQNAIKENNDEIERLELEDKLYKFKNSVTGLTNQYDIWADKIDLIDTKLNNSLETEKVALMGDKITALNKQLEFQEKILDSLKSQMSVYQDALSKYDVEFGAKGNITNMSTVLNKYQNSEDLEKINDLMEEYNDLVRDAIPNAEKEYAELNNTIQDVYDTQLETVKTIEDKITEVIKDQLDKRKELIQKQYDSEIDLLNKRKEEYNKSKETDDYYEDLEEAQEEINNIQKKINTVSLDDSLEGRSKLDEYLEDLKEAQDKYNELVANRTDTLINDMYDNEIDRLQEESESKIEDLENEWTDSKIAEIVAQSLGEGVFTDIDGEVHNLQDTLITFAEDSGEALGVLGDRIKNELSLNLQDALNYIKEYDEIINSMGLKQLGNVNYSDKVNSKSLAIDDISINVYGTESMNEKQLAEEVSKQIENKLSEITNGGLL